MASIIKKNSFIQTYNRLYERYGPQNWWPADSAFEIIIGAILTQSTSWVNAKKALENLKSSGYLSPHKIRSLSHIELANLLRPSQYFNSKAKKVQEFSKHLGARHEDDIDKMLSQDTTTLRKELLSIYGIGQETTDDILLYAAQKPVFVVDSYTRRIFARLRLSSLSQTYLDYQQLFQKHLPNDKALYNEYHALIVRHAKIACKTDPLCTNCCLIQSCHYGKNITINA